MSNKLTNLLGSLENKIIVVTSPDPYENVSNASHRSDSVVLVVWNLSPYDDLLWSIPVHQLEILGFFEGIRDSYSFSIRDLCLCANGHLGLWRLGLWHLRLWNLKTLLAGRLCIPQANSVTLTVMIRWWCRWCSSGTPELLANSRLHYSHLLPAYSDYICACNKPTTALSSFIFSNRWVYIPWVPWAHMQIIISI